MSKTGWIERSLPTPPLARDTAVLRSIKTLEIINGKPPAEFWKEVDAKKPEKP